MSRVRIVGGRPPTIEIDGVNVANAVGELQILMEPGKVPLVRLTVPACELDVELDADVVKILDELDVEGDK